MERADGSRRDEIGAHRFGFGVVSAAQLSTRSVVIAALALATVGLIELAIVSKDFWNPPPSSFCQHCAGAPQQPPTNGIVNATFPAPASNTLKDDHFGGLLSSDFDRSSCVSRYESAIYRKPSSYKPSIYLIKKLRQYEARHRRCGPGTNSFNEAIRILKPRSADRKALKSQCRYIVWAPAYGLGNRIISLASTFLYALLTDRIVLVHQMEQFAGLMCEPFPHSTWRLPWDFPIKEIGSFRGSHNLSYRSLIRDSRIRNESVWKSPSFVYIHLMGGYTEEDSYFFCEKDQSTLRKVPWLLVRSDEYFVPALFLNSDFLPELVLMFPEKEAVFHHLCRYLLHPSNEIWGLITRYYETYLAAAGPMVGIQIRVFNEKQTSFDLVLRQVINCSFSEKLLPKINPGRHSAVAGRRKTKATVLITSLYSEFSERIKTMYWEQEAAGGVLVGVHQPSHEKLQMTGNVAHDKRAWAEMNLLGFADVMITSARSTFGYVGQALAGVRPWVLLEPNLGNNGGPACVRDISMEPCLHSVPKYVCRKKKKGDNSRVEPYVTRCMDVPWGVKLVNRT